MSRYSAWFVLFTLTTDRLDTRTAPVNDEKRSVTVKMLDYPGAHSPVIKFSTFQLTEAIILSSTIFPYISLLLANFNYLKKEKSAVPNCYVTEN